MNIIKMFICHWVIWLIPSITFVLPIACPYRVFVSILMAEPISKIMTVSRCIFILTNQSQSKLGKVNAPIPWIYCGCWWINLERLQMQILIQYSSIEVYQSILKIRFDTKEVLLDILIRLMSFGHESRIGTIGVAR